MKTSVDKFRTLGHNERQRWYENEPPYSSFLWYYNYFIMSSLRGNANVNHGGAGVIKNIQVVSHTVPVSGGYDFPIDTVDPKKTVVMLYGNSYISDKIYHYDGEVVSGVETTINLSPQIDKNIAEVKVTGGGGEEDISEGTGSGNWGDFFVTEVENDHIKVKIKDLYSSEKFGYSLDIIEHKAQTIYPIIKEISANYVRIDWAKEPSVEAAVSILVIEYI